MFDDDEEYPQQRNELTDKLRELVDGEVKKELGNRHADLVWHQKERSRLSLELSAARLKIRGLENERTKFQKNHTKAVQRELFGGFTVGDVVYYAKPHEVGRIHCNTCNDTRKVNMSLGERTFLKECPDCYSSWYTRTIYEYKPQRDTVTQINTKLWGGGENRELEIYLDRRDGSSKAGTIFLTAEECQVYCDELNKKEQLKRSGQS